MVCDDGGGSSVRGDGYDGGSPGNGVNTRSKMVEISSRCPKRHFNCWRFIQHYADESRYQILLTQECKLKTIKRSYILLEYYLNGD